MSRVVSGEWGGARIGNFGPWFFVKLYRDALFWDARERARSSIDFVSWRKQDRILAFLRLNR
jgi:hypothetical protein